MEILRLSPRGQPQRHRMGWEMWVGGCAGHLSLLAFIPALAHLRRAALECWHTDGVAGGMQGSAGWEMAAGAAGMIHGSTEGQSGRGKGKVEGGIKNLTLLFQRISCRKPLYRSAARNNAPRFPGCRGTGHPQSWQMTAAWLLPGRTLGVCTDPCLSQPS